ncbi:MAG: adenine deaminase, partial [Methanoregulaceae archaeon]|nr:adenine deaminase [Methanoregulaceae archaeon]
SFSNAEVFNPFTCEWELTDFAVEKGWVTGTGHYRAHTEVDLKGRRVVPGLIDSHVHIESSLLCPSEFARLIAGHGTTTVIADPHEIANVCGATGIDYMLSYRGKIPLDLFIMLPSCVPATPSDVGGAVLEAEDLAVFREREGVIGLGEVMNVPGVLGSDPALCRKLDLFPIVDGHAPFLTGKDLSAYIAAGIQSDHECTSASEAQEKIRKGMFVYLREGSTERNIGDLLLAVTRENSNRVSFATDDRHVDMLFEDGHIDDCIRKAISAGLEPEIALRMATLSPAERFGLSDRGALAPGRVADFCVLSPGGEFIVDQTFRRGLPVRADTGFSCIPIAGKFQTTPPLPGDISLQGPGRARVIGIVPDQIMTIPLVYEILPDEVPDTDRDLLKVVVCSRYHPGRIATGLVHGFSLTEGALAGSVSHDAHNIIAVGVSDDDICGAMRRVIEAKGGLAVVSDARVSLLSLSCAGLMSIKPYEQVYRDLKSLKRHLREIGAIDQAFMYLSFLALTVIPHLRITDRGLFDVDTFTHIPVYS